MNIAEAKARFSELIAAAVRGEDIVVNRAGVPQVRFVPVESAEQRERRERGEKRRRAHAEDVALHSGRYSKEQLTVTPVMTEEEIEASWTEKFGPPPS
ncbi:MAG: type II toxin-antitoxin system prevent-host-death family antitoxin [Pacificimonas sp.]|nr:type II toxin-antitoxin system prevent-host-death family antitoxin [Pacificimonas sp.]